MTAFGRIRVAWIGDAEEDAPLLAVVRDGIAAMLRVPVEGAPPMWPSVTTWDPGRRQHASAKLLAWLSQGASQGVVTLGVTDRDLFIPELTFVYGEARPAAGVAVVSTARLGLPGDERLRERLAKEALHELGHVFGLDHCRSPRCVMRRSRTLAEIDLKSPSPCENCAGRIRV